MNSIQKTLALIPLCFLVAFGQHREAGSSAFSFLSINYDARSVAMGGAASAIQNDLYGILSNPSAIGYAENQQVMVGFRPVMLGVWGGPVAYLRPFDGYGNVALTVIGLTSGELDVINDHGVPTGNVARVDYMAGAVTWAMEVVEELAVGVTVKGVYNRIATPGSYYSADGAAIDGGVQYRINNDRFTVGAAFRNLGFMRSGYAPDVQYPLPFVVEAGISYVPLNLLAVRLALDINKARDDYITFEPGIEISLSENVFLRGGYSMSGLDISKQIDVFRGEKDPDYQKSNMSSLAIGAGIITTIEDLELNIDVALQFYRDVSRPAVLLSFISLF